MTAGLPRLLPSQPEDLRGHLARFGPVPNREATGALIRDVQAAGLTGRGGAAFPVHRKLTAVAAARGRKVVVANGAESEPASRKDEILLRAAPHLVLDGLQLAIEATGASDAYLYLHRGAGSGIERALAGRAARGLDRFAVTITETPPRFLAGQESAVVNRLGGGPALPTFTPPRVSKRGLHGQPTLVQNVETLAHLALIARYGPGWFRAAGTASEPGSMLTTLYPAYGGCQVSETEIGLPHIAAALAELAGPRPRRQTHADVERWAGLVIGRGACSHPDGTVRFVRSALRVFEPELTRHERGQCLARNRRPFLPLPDSIPTHEDDWI